MIQTHVLLLIFLQYDLKLEKSVIQWAETKQLARKQQAEENLRLEEEKKRQPVAPVAEESDRKAIAPSSTEDVTGKHSVTSQKNFTPSSLVYNPANVFQLSSASGILVPTQISSGASPHEPRRHGGGNIDLRDFESEQDPFENLSLRVMNDREELDKVFLASGSQSSSAQAVDYYRSGVGYHAGNGVGGAATNQAASSRHAALQRYTTSYAPSPLSLSDNCGRPASTLANTMYTMTGLMESTTSREYLSTLSELKRQEQMQMPSFNHRLVYDGRFAEEAGVGQRQLSGSQSFLPAAVGLTSQMRYNNGGIPAATGLGTTLRATRSTPDVTS